MAGSGGPTTIETTEEAPRGLSLYNCTLFSSLSYKGKRIGSRRGDRTQTKHTRPRGDQVDGWSPPEAHKHTLTAGKEVGRAPSSSRRQLP